LDVLITKDSGKSRSRLFASAVSDFLQRHRKKQMLARLNEVYASEAQPMDKRLLKGIKTKVVRTIKEKQHAPKDI
jgi:metal-responsive CopG/Arc/MetJ family transcriptional regulator